MRAVEEFYFNVSDESLLAERVTLSLPAGAEILSVLTDEEYPGLVYLFISYEKLLENEKYPREIVLYRTSAELAAEPVEFLDTIVVTTREARRRLLHVFEVLSKERI